MNPKPLGAGDAPADDDGRQYHIGLAPGDVAPSILLVGDPGRVMKGAGLLENPSPPRAHREYTSTTGHYKGKAVTLLGTGIGSDNTEIAIVELSRIIDPAKAVLIRIGSSGAISGALRVGDLVVSTGAFRLESTSLAYVDPGFPAIAHHEVVQALVDACEKAGERYFTGITASACGFYGAQGRPVEGLPTKYPDRVDRLAAQRVLNMEMECSTLFTMATLLGMKAGAVCAVFADRQANEFLDAEGRNAAEIRALTAGLEAVVRI